MHDPMSVKVHGTYPWDEGPKWKRLESITWKEAAKLMGIDEASVFVDRGDGDVYLWLNKGFVVLDLPKDEGATASQMAAVEMVGSARHKDIRPGMRAIYLHDGQYSLLERVG